jgi:hypothetical protein
MVALLAVTQPAAASAFVDGNSLLSLCVSGKDFDFFNCIGYIKGINDAANSNPINGYRACVPQPVTVGQIKDIVIEHLRHSAAERHLMAAGLVARALEQSFPCR